MRVGDPHLVATVLNDFRDVPGERIGTNYQYAGWVGFCNLQCLRNPARGQALDDDCADDDAEDERDELLCARVAGLQQSQREKRRYRSGNDAAWKYPADE